MCCCCCCFSSALRIRTKSLNRGDGIFAFGFVFKFYYTWIKHTYILVVDVGCHSRTKDAARHRRQPNIGDGCDFKQIIPYYLLPKTHYFLSSISRWYSRWRFFYYFEFVAVPPDCFGTAFGELSIVESSLRYCMTR